MVLFNYSTKELTAKIVYYGPGLCGKTTNLQYVHQNLPENVKGKMLSLATKTDRTLFFDFLPIDLGEIRGMQTRVQLYTVPGQVFYNETRKLVLKGADGIVFVADSQQQMLSANQESFKNLEDNMRGHGMNLAEIPHVLQFNKRDLPKLASIEEMNAAINKFNAPFYESVATTGIGVQDSLKAITKLVLLHLTKKYSPRVPAARTAAAPEPTVQVPAPTPATAEPTAAPASAGIPLSDAADARVPAPTAVASAGVVAAEQPVPSFDQDDIDELVGEVEETAPAPTAIEIDPAVAAAAAADAVYAGQKAARPGVPSPAFEVDHGADPEWAPDAQVRSAASVQAAPVAAPPAAAAAVDVPPLVEPAALDSPALGVEHDALELPDIDIAPVEALVDAPVHVPVDAPVHVPVDAPVDPPVEAPVDASVEAPVEALVDAPVEVPVAAPVDAPVPDGEVPVAVELTELVGDRDLFDDPSVQVAGLSAGEEREIVIPVEMVGEGSAVQRFKLAVRLRLDPVE